jgi:hypothetical protein
VTDQAQNEITSQPSDAVHDLCHRIHVITATEYPLLRQKLSANLLMAGANVQSKGASRLRELDACFYIIESAMDEFCQSIGSPWEWPPVKARADMEGSGQ